MELASQTATELVDQLCQGELTSQQCTEYFLQRIESTNGQLNAFTTVSAEAMAAAEKIDARRAAGEKLGALAGLPVAIKDGICTAGIRTTAGSRMLENFVPPYDATIVRKIMEADGVIIGKTNMDEFAMGSSTENSYYGTSLNPWDTDRVPGGSSGGSGTCVAADMTPIAIGSDTGGSIRQPAAFCGITGLKPTYGRVSRFGLIAFASSLDQIGPMTRTAEDCALTMDVIGGYDPRDSTSSKEALPDFRSGLGKPLSGLKIGVCQEHFESGLESTVADSVKSAVEVLKSLGAEVTEINLPHTPYAVAAYYVIAPCEASSNLSRYDGVRYTTRADAKELEAMYSETRALGFGAEVKRRIMLGTYALSSGYYDAYYIKASKVRRLIKQDYDEAFQTVDLILGPTTPTSAFKLGEHVQNPLAMYLADVYTVSANLAGVPAISIPCGFDDKGLPIGLQLQAKSFDEATLLNVAHQYQQTTDWHQRRPSA